MLKQQQYMLQLSIKNQYQGVQRNSEANIASQIIEFNIKLKNSKRFYL